jgi:hypothetical protein
MERISRLAHDCDCKRPYPTFTRARHAARALHRNTDDVVHPYRCGVCGKWHLGGVPDARPRRPRNNPPMPPSTDRFLETAGAGVAGRPGEPRGAALV